MERNDLYAEILATVVENGRLNFGFDQDELEAEIQAECTERELPDDEVIAAVEYALEHIG